MSGKTGTRTTRSHPLSAAPDNTKHDFDNSPPKRRVPQDHHTHTLRRPFSLRTQIHTILSQLGSVLLAARCRVCRETLTSFSRVPLCELCLGRVSPLALPASCTICQRPLSAAALAAEPQANYSATQESNATLLCGPCHRGDPSVDSLRSFGSYDGTLRAMILLLKYERVRTLAHPLGNWLAQALATHPARNQIDMVVPVPLHPRRQRKRGFNQAELLARALTKKLTKNTPLPVQPRLLTRIKNTPPQTGLTVAQREKNMHNAFEVRRKLDGQRILVLDDICTTGATLNACAQALRRAGAANVYGLTVARVLQDI